MNKIYKVIWNKTRGMYMVVSELAKGQSKDGRRAVGRKKVAQAAAALAVFFSVVSMGGTSFAADTTKVDSSTSDTAVEVYTKAGTDAQIEAAKKYTYRKAAELDQKLTDQKTSTALHISSSGDLIVGTKENQTVKDMEIRGKLTSGSISTGGITSTGDVTVAGKMAADGVTDETTKDGTYIKQNNTVGKNLGSLDTQVKANADAIAEKVNAADVYTKDETDQKVDAANTYTYRKVATEEKAREAADTELNKRITNEANAIHDEIKVGDKALDDRITNVKEYLEKQTSDNYVSKADAAVQDGAIVKADKTIGENVTNLDAALAKETAARIGADKAQDAVIQQVNQNAANGIATLATAYNNEVASREAADNELNERITNEANAIHETTNKLQDDLNTETTARGAADTALDTRITNVKEYLEKQTSDNYVSKADAAVQDGAIVKAANTIGENVTNLDAALAKETAARIGADAAQDKVIEQVNQNMVDGFNTINTNMANGFAALNAADAAEKDARIGADKKLAEAVNSGLSLSDDNVLQKNTTAIDAQGNVTTSKTDAKEMILNKDKDNQITLNEKGIKVGTNSTVVDKDGVYTGGDTYSEAKAAMSSDGSIKGANGKFTVDSATGSVNINDQISLNGATGAVKANSLNIGDGNFKIDSNGAMSAANGSFKVDSNGAINAAGGNFKVDSNGGVTAANGKASIDSNGKITSTGLDAGNGTIQTTGTVKAGTVEAGTVNTGDLNVTGKATVKDLDVTGEFNAKTLNSKVDANNYTTITGGNVTSKNFKMSDDGEIQASSSTFNEKGSTVWARDDESKGTSTVTADSVKESISDVGDNVKNYASRELHQNTDNKYEITDSVVEDKNSNVTNKTATQSESTISDGSDTNKSTFRQKIDQILQEIKSAKGSTTVTQTDVDITNTAKNGTITNDAQNLVNKASSDMTNTIGGKMLNDVTGDMENKVGGNLINTVAGNMTSDVTGDSSLTAENINNTAKNKITNKALDVETDASSSIVSKVSNEYGSNTSTQLSYQTTEEMSQADGKKASYLRGAAEEKSQLTDGDKKTTVDTIAGQTNTNITDGTNTSNSLQKADQVASSVTDGTNTTVVNQDANSLASSITDGTKANNTNSTVDKSEQLIKASDSQYNASVKTATASAERLVSGNIIDILKDAENGYVNTTVTSSDGASSTSVQQGNKDITNTAKQGTITNEAKNLVNKAAENITNTAGTRIQDKVGTTTVTTTDGLTKLTNEAGNHKTQMDYAEVLKDLGVKGNATIDKDLSVGGNATVVGDVTASSYKVGDKTYINQNGLNANNQKVTNVADGDVSEGSTDAVNGGQLHATNQRVSTVENRMDGVENRVDRVENRVDNLDNRIDKVGASAAAMANLHPMDFDEDSKVSVAAAVGSYRSETAGALGVFYRPTDRVMMNVSTSFGNGENMVGGGVSFKLGKSSKRLQQAEATNAALSKQVANLQNRLDVLLGVLNPNLSKAFPDVPANHWAYEAVSKLAGNDIVQGYEDGKYHGERTMSRYEMAEIIYNALSKGAKAEAKLVEEFRPELQAMAAQRKA